MNGTAPPSETIRNFVLFASAQGVSAVGTWMHKTAVGWLTWELTQSPAWVGAMAITDLVAALWVGPFAGAVSDRHNPFRLLLTTQSLLLCLALLLFGLYEAGWITIWVLWSLSVVESTFQGFNQPVRMSTIGLLAGRERLSQAIASNSIAVNVARATGPAIAGAIMLSGSVGAVFAVNAVSFLAMIGAVLYLRRWIDRPARGQRAPLARDIAEGFRYVRRTSQIGILFLLALLFSLFARPMFELLPAIAGDVFDGGPETLAGLMSAQGVGALIGASFMLKRRVPSYLVAATFGAGIGLTVALIAFCSTTMLWIALPIMVIAGLCHIIAAIGMQAMAQIYSASAFHGRVLGLYGLLVRTAPSVGAFAIGLGAAVVDLRLLIGLSALVAGLGILALVPSARRVYAKSPERD